MQRTLAQLTLECGTREIPLVENTKYGRKDLVNLIAKQSYSRISNPAWGLTKRLEIESPMLCFPWWHLKATEKESIMASTD